MLKEKDEMNVIHLYGIAFRIRTNRQKRSMGKATSGNPA